MQKLKLNPWNWTKNTFDWSNRIRKDNWKFKRFNSLLLSSCHPLTFSPRKWQLWPKAQLNSFCQATYPSAISPLCSWAHVIHCWNVTIYTLSQWDTHLLVRGGYTALQLHQIARSAQFSSKGQPYWQNPYHSFLDILFRPVVHHSDSSFGRMWR